jgi:hypothetical protein
MLGGSPDRPPEGRFFRVQRSLPIMYDGKINDFIDLAQDMVLGNEFCHIDHLK